MRPLRSLRLSGLHVACALAHVGLLAGLLFPSDSHARQEIMPDSTRQSADQSTRANSPTRADVDTARLPIQALNTDLSIHMGQDPGVFAYTFDAAGWPNGLSAWGRDPNHTRLLWEGRSVDDLLTGRPRFDMVPVAFLASAAWTKGGDVDVRSDSLPMPSPVTRVRYESAGDGLQSVKALHVQNRIFRTSDSTSVRLQTVFGYAGAGAQGEYDGTRLQRAREITARVGLTGHRWSAWVQDVASRRAVGAHAGVEPFTSDYESIYQRLGAVVSDPTARRRTVRNDLELGGSTSLHGWNGTLRAVRTSQTLDFEGSTLSARAWTTRWQLLTALTADHGPGLLTLDAQVLRDTGFGGSAWGSEPEKRTFGAVTARYSKEQVWSLETGIREDTYHSWWHANASGTLDRDLLSIDGLVVRSARRITLLEMAGFGAGIEGISAQNSPPLQAYLLARAGAQLNSEAWTLRFEGSHLSEQDAIVHQMGSAHPDLDSSVMSGRRTRSTASLSLGWRNDGRHGMYAHTAASRTFTSRPDDSALSLLWESSMPEQWASVRLGWRDLLFRGDLDLDLFIRARLWDSMNGLRLHTPTGLLVLPQDASVPVDGNWLVDVIAEGDVRGATMFFAYENMFSGTNLQVGNLIIPDYPLPRQRIRFGVYWPIAN